MCCMQRNVGEPSLALVLQGTGQAFGPVQSVAPSSKETASASNATITYNGFT